jgi:hypothetical protein
MMMMEDVGIDFVDDDVVLFHQQHHHEVME